MPDHPAATAPAAPVEDPPEQGMGYLTRPVAAAAARMPDARMSPEGHPVDTTRHCPGCQEAEEVEGRVGDEQDAEEYPGETAPGHALTMGP